MTFSRKEMFTLLWVLRDKLEDLRYLEKNSESLDESESSELESDINQVISLINSLEDLI